MSRELKFQTRAFNKELAIFDVTGAMNIYNAGELRDAFEKLSRSGVKNYIVNIQALDTIDSAGIGVLFTMLSAVQSTEGQAIILSPNETIRKLLDVTQVSAYFTIMDSEAEAVAAIRGK